MTNNDTEKNLQKYVEDQEKSSTIGPELTKTPKDNHPENRSTNQISLGNQLGWQKLPIKDLPTQGLFYPEGTEIAIRAAVAGEIRHWSTLQEDDFSLLDDMLNYILERCVAYKTSDPHSSWKDIKEIDRFYILLAIREYTFIKGENQLQVKTSETTKIDVTKDMIDFVSFDERLMKYYDSEKRYFLLKFKKSNMEIKVSIPSIGVTHFLKNYINRKQALQQLIDNDFMSFAPFILLDWRGLNDSSYEKIILDSYNWGIEEISVLTHLRDIFTETVNPVVKYIDEGGAERIAPLNFLGGLKSIFLISDPFRELV